MTRTTAVLLTASMLLSVIFLSAGAFAGQGPHKQMAPAAPAASTTSNVTTVAKNGVWPPAALVSMEPCTIRRCYDI
jgi:hypothetical protein